MATLILSDCQLFEGDFDKLDALLATPDFKPIDFINHVFPTEESLSTLDKEIANLSQRIRIINKSIRQSVRSYGVLGDSSEQILANTIKTIQTLTKKITSIQDQATRTETVVSDLCGSIKPLHNARINLQGSIKAIEQFRMIVDSMRQLETCIIDKNYLECSRILDALTDLLQIYDPYKDTPQLKPIYDEYTQKKKTLRFQITTFVREIISKGTADESFQDVCHCIDAYNDDFHDEVVKLLCNRLLETYETAFPINQSKPELKYENRFIWFKNRIEFFNERFQNAFPEDWEMNFQIAKSFCEKTAEVFKQILNVQETPNIKEYLSAFEKTVKFENKLAKEFSRLIVLPFNPNAVMPDFGTDAAGIKKKI